MLLAFRLAFHGRSHRESEQQSGEEQAEDTVLEKYAPVAGNGGPRCFVASLLGASGLLNAPHDDLDE